MNRSKMLNILGRLTHASIGRDLAQKFDLIGASYYLKDFISITRKEIEEAFDFLPTPLIISLCGLMKTQQEKIEESFNHSPNDSCIAIGNMDLGIVSETSEMIYDLLE